MSDIDNNHIDPEKLEEAVKAARRDLNDADVACLNAGHLRLLEAAARAHLATLPRWKEVEVVRWGAFDSDGTCIGTWDNLGAAHGVIRSYPRGYVIRLTGTAKMKVAP